MKILAVEFSSERRSVAVVHDGRVLAEAVEMGGRAAIELVEKALAEGKVEREQIECIAVGIGPGSYTGIRGAISLAQGWQLGREVKIVGISSVECVAAQAQRDKVFNEVAVIVDAQRDEFYAGQYSVDANGYKEVAPLRIVPRAEAKALNATLVGPDAERLRGQGATFKTFPEAAMLGQLASRRSNFILGEKLEPIYLREVNFVKVQTPAVKQSA
jgi:tRNA threonylcarbamoyladenosine biosynthesis protein TsaB